MGSGWLTLPGSELPGRGLQQPDTLPRPGSARSSAVAPKWPCRQSWASRGTGRCRPASLGADPGACPQLWAHSTGQARSCSPGRGVGRRPWGQTSSPCLQPARENRTTPCGADTGRVAAPGWVRGHYCSHPSPRKQGEVDPLERTSRSLRAGALRKVCLGWTG